MRLHGAGLHADRLGQEFCLNQLEVLKILVIGAVGVVAMVQTVEVLGGEEAQRDERCRSQRHVPSSGQLVQCQRV